MDVLTFEKTVLVPGLTWTNGIYRMPEGFGLDVGMLTIAGTESRYTDRVQGGPIPAAHGLFQFEERGGVAGVLGSHATRGAALSLCASANVEPNSHAVWTRLALPQGDNLSVGFARLLLWSDPRPLPVVNDQAGWWDYYIRNWRPGKPDRGRFEQCWLPAYQLVTGQKF